MNDPIPITRAVDHGTARLLPDIDRPRAWLLTVDDAPQSYVDLDDPGYLEFEYARRLAHVIDTMAGPGEAFEVLHLGGGAMSLPRYIAAQHPGAGQRVIEADRRLSELVREQLPPPAGSRITTEIEDARAALEDTAPGSVDIVIADVFGRDRIPAHLTTLEYARGVARVLRPGGLYAANLADAAPFGFLRSQCATFAEVFPERCLVAEPAVLRGRRFGNAVLVAGRAPLPVADLARRVASDPFPAQVLHSAALERFAAGASPVPDEQARPSPKPPAGVFSVG